MKAAFCTICYIRGKRLFVSKFDDFPVPAHLYLNCFKCIQRWTYMCDATDRLRVHLDVHSRNSSAPFLIPIILMGIVFSVYVYVFAHRSAVSLSLGC